MDIGLYQSAASLSALERWQDAVAQNISSSQVTGYRERTVNFSVQESGQFLAGGKFGDDDDAQPGSFPVATNGVSFANGETQPTSRPLDLALQSQGFFQVQMQDGTRAYTRNGAFTERNDGTLVDMGGDPVMGTNNQPIMLSPGGGDITINRAGVVSQGTSQLGTIAVTGFSNEAGLMPIAGGMFVATANAGAAPVANPGVLQSHLESSNVSPLREMVNMVMISRAYEANQKVITNADQQTQKTMDALG